MNQNEPEITKMNPNEPINQRNQNSDNPVNQNEPEITKNDLILNSTPENRL